MATKTFMGFDPVTGAASEFEGKLARKTQNAITSAAKAGFRAEMGVPGSAEGLTPGNNLSDVGNVATSRQNLDVLNKADTRALSLFREQANAAWFDGAASVLSNADTGDLANFGDGAKDYPLYVAALIWIDDVDDGFPICGRFDSAKREWFLNVNSSGFLNLRLYDNSAAQVISATATTLALTSKTWAFVEVFYSGLGGSLAAGGVSMRVNGVACTVNPSNSASYVAMEDKAGSFRVGEDNNGGTHAKGYISSVLLGTFDPGTGNIDSRVLFEDQWAALAYDHDADFTSDSTDSYSASGGAADATTTVGGEADNIQFTIDSSTGVHQLARSISVTAGKRYDWEVEVYIPSGNTDIDGVVLKDDASGISENFEGVTQDSWHRLDTSGIAAGTTMQIRALKGSDVSFAGNGTDTFAVRLSRVRKGGIRASYQARNLLPNGNLNDESLNGLHLEGTSVTPLFRPTRGQFVEEVEAAHGAISSSAATTELLSLPKGCRIVGIETIVDTAFDGSTTLSIGITGTATKYVNALDVASTGRNYNASTEASESDTSDTSIYVQKNQATTLGSAKFRVIYEITNPTNPTA